MCSSSFSAASDMIDLLEKNAVKDKCVLSKPRAGFSALPRFGRIQVPDEPIRCQGGDLFERARLLKKVSSSRNDNELLLRGAESIERLLVQADNWNVVASNNQQGRCLDARQSGTRQVRSSAARDDCTDCLGLSRSRYQRRARTGAGAEVADRQIAGFGLVD